MTITSVTTSTTSQYTIGSGNELLVANGGSVTAALIQTGGQLVVSGGVDSNATIAAGATETVSTGSASGDLIYGALANVSGVAGHLTNEVIESGGTFNETNSAVVVGTEVLSGGTFILSGNTSGGNSNTTLVGGGVVELITAKSTLGGTLTFSGGGNTLETSATISAGYGDEAVISGFSSSDKIDIATLLSAGATLSVTTSGGNTIATVANGGVSEAFIFSGTTTYTSNTLALAADSSGHAEIVYVSSSGPVGSTTSVTTPTAPGAYTETAGNTLLVLNGGSISAATIDNGAFLTVNGGVDAGAIISAGGAETVSAGSASNDVISGALLIAGGAVTSETVVNGGRLVVAVGGAESNAVVSAGGSATVQGSATGDQIYGALATVSGVSGVLTGETVENGGVFTLANANTASSTTVLSGGAFVVSGADAGAFNTVLSGGGVLNLDSPKAQIDGSLTFSGGGNTLEVAALTTSAGLGDQAVISGFSTTDKIDVTPISAVGASLTVVSSGGNDVATVTGAAGSAAFIFAGTTTYTNFTLQLATDANGDAEVVYNPNATGFTVSTGQTSTGLTVSSGQTLTVQSGGAIISTTVDSGGSVVVSGADTSATLLAGGSATVFGSASGDQIAGGLTLYGAASNETVLAGGGLAVIGGANTSATVSAGATEIVTNSGSTTGDQVYGSVTVNGGTDSNETIHSGGSVTLSAGANTSATVENGGALAISGGVDSSTTILAGGDELVLTSASGDQIHGTQLVSAATAVVTGETVYAGGDLDVFLKGGIASGTTVSSGGFLNVSGFAYASNTVLSGGGTLELQSPKAEVTGTLTFAGGGNTLEITGTTSAGYGDMAVAEGFSNTDKIDIAPTAFVASALTVTQTTSGANTVAEVISGGSTVVETFTFAGALSGNLALVPDGAGGVDLEIVPVSVTTSVTTPTASGGFTEFPTNTLLVLDGGSVTAATIDGGAFLVVNGGTDAAAVISAGGLETVSAGSASGDQIFGSAIVDGGVVSSETVLSGGQLSIGAGASASNVVLSGGAVANLTDPTASLTGAITFTGGGNTLEASAIAGAAYGDQAVISGFSTADKIDVTGISPTGATLSFTSNGAGDAVATISGAGGSQSFVFSDPNAYNAGTMSLLSDGSGGVDLILDTTPVVTLTSLGGETNTATDIVNGTVDTSVDPEAIGTTVTVSEGSTVVGSGVVGANGQWSAKVTFLNDNGANVLSASDTDAAGNKGVTSQSLTYTVNTTAAAFTPGDLVISISGDGDGSGAYGDNAASPVTLEQITTGGTFVSQLVLPQTTTVVNGVTEYAISSEYGSQSEGSLALSADGHSLVIAGYGVNAATFDAASSSVYGTNALAQSTSVPGGQYTVVPRVIADINADGVVDTSTALENVSNENNPRSVVTVNGSSFYLSGQGVKGDATQGVFYAQDGASSATAINTATDTRTAVIYNGQLYVSADSTQGGGTTNISSYGALPTSATSPTVLTGLSNSIVLTGANANTANAGDVGQTVNLSPENFFFANANTLYVADSGNPKEGGIGDGGLQKWTYNGSQWTLQYTLSAGLNLVPGTAAYGTSGLIGLTGKVVGNSVELYATSYNLTDIEPTYVYAITDTLNATSGTGESFSTIYTAAPGSNIRGVAFAPTAYAPTITGTLAGQATTSEVPIALFSGVTIGDANANATDTLTITVGGAGGTLTGAGLTGGSGGVYTLSGSAAAVTSELDALSFTPTAGQPNTTSTSTFSLSDLSSADATPATDTATTVVDTDPSAGPTITGTVAGQTTTSEAPVSLFSGVTISDANANATDTLTITVGGAGGTLTGTGLTGGAGGVYTLSGAAATVTSEVDALSFTPTAGQPGSTSTSTFTLSDLSSANSTPAVDTKTTVLDSDRPSAPVLGAVVGRPVNGGAVDVTGTGQTGDTVTLYADGGTTPVGAGTVAGGTFNITTGTTGFDFTDAADGVTAVGSVDVVNGQAISGTGYVTGGVLGSAKDAITLVTPNTPGAANLGGGNLSYRFGGGTDLIGDTAVPVDGNGLIFTVATSNPSLDVGLNIYSTGGTSYQAFLAGNSGIYDGYNGGLTTSVLFPDGHHTLTATETDAAGLTSAVSNVLPVSVYPTAPVISALVGQPVNGGTIDVTGTGETNGDTIKLYADGGTAVVGTGTVANGQFNITTTATFAGGNHTLTATETDAAGLTSAASAGFTAPVFYVLTTGPDQILGGLPNVTIEAAANTLSSNDYINPSPGGNILKLLGGGAFNLAKPALLNYITTVEAQDGVGAAAQTITTRADLNLTIDVASGGAGSKTTIIGAANADVFDLGGGADVVTLGGAGEQVVGGAGADVVNATAATVGALITDASKTVTLKLSGGGSATMNAGDTGIATVDLAASTTAYNFKANAESGLVIDDLSHGADTVAAGGSGETITGGLTGDLTMVGFGSGTTTYKDTTTAFNDGDTIHNFSEGDRIDLTNLKFGSKTTLAVTSVAPGEDVLTVSVSGVVKAKVAVFGQFMNFMVGGDGGSGTLITDPAQPAATTLVSSSLGRNDHSFLRAPNHA